MLCTKKRCKRFEFYTKKWPKREITYRIDNWPSKTDICRQDIPQLFKEAFQLWSDVSPLVFREVGKNELANTNINFKKRAHGDKVEFDGPRGTLAHAYHLMGGYGELNGDIHFDDDEYWTWKSNKGMMKKMNLFIVAAHEMGHVIGLAHSKVPTSLMWENYQEFKDGYTLSEDDVKGIQHIYGKHKRRKTEGAKTGRIVPVSKSQKSTNKKHNMKNKNILINRPKNSNSNKNRLTTKCDWSLDGVTQYRGEIMIFKGNRIWRMKEDGTMISSEDGELASSYWYNLPSDIEAVYERYTDRALIFVKGRYLYVYRGPHQYPIFEARPLQKEMPKGVDAALSVFESDEEGLYLFKNKHVWKVDVSTYRIESGYPRKISSMWKKLPRDVNAAYHQKGYVYFFRNGRVFKTKFGKTYVTRYKRPHWQKLYQFTRKC
ncbi:collagenase 3-like [Antedon mediterranea]|uniref:collagenase 3-like n=1 Tax=Antedon mediterranea TaxID=105859 RepID=UPI003AF4ED70